MPVARLVWLQPHLQEQAKIAEDKQWQELENYVIPKRQKERLEHQTQVGIRIYHYHNDHLGTPQELTNSLGEVVWLNYSQAWGGSYETKCFAKELDNLDVSADLLQPIRFQGQFFDGETNLHYNRFRYYDSDVGMFVSRDPIELLGGFNVFEYASNPIIWIDEFGLKKYHRKDGTWGKKRGRPPKPKPKSSHGNSDDNPNCTTLYRLNYLDKDYTFSKWGVTSNSNPLTRYSSTELGNRVMTVIAIGKYGTGNRTTMKQLERLLVESHPGPDNNEAWAGKGHDKRTPEEIISDFASKNPCVKIIRKS